MDIKERLETASNAELVVNANRLSISRPSSLPGMEVVGIQPIYVPGSPLDHSELCVSRCGFLTYSLCSTTVNGKECKSDESYFYFYDLTQDRLVKYSVDDLHKAADATDSAASKKLKAENHDYLVIRVHFFQTKTPYAMAKDSIGIYSSVPTVLTSASTLRMDVNTQGRFYGGALLENPDGIVPLSHMFVTDIESPPMGFLSDANIAANKNNLFAAALAANKSAVVFRLAKDPNRRMPAFLPVSLGNYGFEKSGLLFDSAQTAELQNKFALDGKELSDCNLNLLAEMSSFKPGAAGSPSIADIDLKTGRFKAPVIMYRDYSGSVLVGAAGGKPVTDEVNSEAPYGRVVNGLGKILTGDAQADSKVHQGSLSPLQALLLRSM
jgi:hypothetical protein